MRLVVALMVALAAAAARGDECMLVMRRSPLVGVRDGASSELVSTASADAWVASAVGVVMMGISLGGASDEVDEPERL